MTELPNDYKFLTIYQLLSVIVSRAVAIFADDLCCQWRDARSCQKATADAAATLSESTPWAIGIRIT